ncbi:MAG: glycosyltransferase [Pyrinomonadaceae bacterium]
MAENLRVAFFADTFLEVNGAAMTCRRLVEYAKTQGHPFLSIHAGERSEVTQDGSVTSLVLKRSPFSFSLDQDLAYDPFFQRYSNRVLREIVKFSPDVIHITGLNDVSIIGAYLAWKLKLPLLGSWHTNLHEFAAQRLNRMLRFLPAATAMKISGFAQRKILDGAVLYYKQPKVILSPNPELVEILGKGTGRVSRLMSRGVDTDKFSPQKRTVNDGVFRFGFVGRLRPEKNVRMLVDIEQALIKAGKTNFEFLIVGEGSEREFLEKTMRHAKFTGFIDGEQLSAAYANMDVFVFPSDTETFGNVTFEANASGVPAVVSDKGGSKFLIEAGINGFVAGNLDDFVKFSLDLLDSPEKLTAMKLTSRQSAMSRSWDAVFKSVYDAYAECIKLDKIRKAAEKNGGKDSK